MATAYTQRLIIVARSTFVASANTAAKQVDTVGGERTFTVPLRNVGDVTNTVRAYICDWRMTPTELTALRSRFQTVGATTRERTVVSPTVKGTYSPNLSDRLYMFDANDVNGWTAQEVRNKLGMDSLASIIV